MLLEQQTEQSKGSDQKRAFGWGYSDRSIVVRLGSVAANWKTQYGLFQL